MNGVVIKMNLRLFPSLDGLMVDVRNNWFSLSALLYASFNGFHPFCDFFAKNKFFLYLEVLFEIDLNIGLRMIISHSIYFSHLR